jgi:hypothetical protein
MGNYVSKLSHRLGMKVMSKEVSWFIITPDVVRKGTMITLHVICTLENSKHVHAPQICYTSSLNWLERSCHLWTSTFLFKSAPYPLIHAYFPPFVYLHCIHDLCISHNLLSKLQISLLRKRSPLLRKHYADFLTTQTLVGIIHYAKPVALFSAMHPLFALNHCVKTF